jgi:hypothetical protein
MPLVQQWLALSATDRDLVIEADRSPAKPRKLRTMSWETPERGIGIVSLGGNAARITTARGSISPIRTLA